METLKKAIFFFILPIVGVLFYQPSTLGSAFSILWVALVIFVGWGFCFGMVIPALTFMIFINGNECHVRLMMLLSTSFSEEGVFNLPFFALD